MYMDSEYAYGIRIFLSNCICMCTRACVCWWVYMRVYLCMRMCMPVRICMCRFTFRFIFTFLSTYIYNIYIYI